MHRPRTAAPDHKAAVLIDIHGGPEGQYEPFFSGETQHYVSELGIAVIYPNVRGSSGYGKTYLKLDNAELREESVAAIVFVFDLGLAAWLWVTDPSRWPVGVAIAVIPLLVLVSAPIFVWAARTEARFDLAGLLATGLLLRFGASFYRLENAADARQYHLIGSNLAVSFRHFDFGVDARGAVPGTGGLNFLTGLAEVVANANKFATFLLFTWLGFIGCFLLYRAFVTALPDADHRRYALLIFLWPTLLFWPSSIGKDCWMLFTLGIGALGAARVNRFQPLSLLRGTGT
jgi:hypothetical protein